MAPKLQELGRQQASEAAGLRERRAQAQLAAENDAMEIASEKVRPLALLCYGSLLYCGWLCRA